MRTPSSTQLQAINHLSGPAQVIAGPGSGKTFTIIQRILSLVRNHKIPPEQILVVTFTKAAALEMKERYEAASSDEICSGHVNFGTFHSICYHILQKSGGFSPNSLINETDRRNILKIILSNYGYSAHCDGETLQDVLSAVSKRKNIPETEEGMGMFSAEEIRIFTEEYCVQLKERRQLDFDDMITECLQLLQSRKELAQKYREQFSYLLVDEFQDINEVQYQVLRLLAEGRNNLFVVGDDDQAIYGFRGANPGIMKQFLLDYPDCARIFLTENYRCGREIVELAGKVIERNTERVSKHFLPMREKGKTSFYCLDSRKEEEELLLKEVGQLPFETQRKSALILRTNREVMQYRELLNNHRVPVKELTVSGEDWLHGFIAEDIAAFLRFLYEGHRRTDFLKFMNKPNHYFTRLALTKETVDAESMKQYYMQNDSMKREVDSYFRRLKTAEALSVYMAVTFFRKHLGYDKFLREKAQNPQEEKRFLEQADQIRQLFGKMEPGICVDEILKEAGRQHRKSSAEMVQTEGIRVITMHAAKGLEFDHVFLPDINDGIIPGKNCTTKRELEEERRLLYVAITRARDVLHIYCTKERNRKPSSYLKGIILPQ